jgi:hypothetical protein
MPIERCYPARAPDWHFAFPAVGGKAMKKSLPLLAAAISSMSLLCGAQTATAAASLPGVTIEAPKHAVARPHRPRQSAVASRRISPIAQTAAAAPDSESAKLAKLANNTSSCAGGCVTSLKYGDAPWHGCSVSGWPMLSPTCRNTGNFKTYTECTSAGLLMGWRNNDVGWYCSSLALK